MRKNTGYRRMLRDGCPATVNYALKWQKAKERWIDHTYNSFIRIFCDKKERDYVTRIILGIAKNATEDNTLEFDFFKSIDWENLSEDEKAYWERIQSWVSWFDENYSIIKKEYEISLEKGTDEFTIKVNLISNYLSSLLPKDDADEEEKQAKYEYVDNLVEFLIKCFNKST